MTLGNQPLSTPKGLYVVNRKSKQVSYSFMTWGYLHPAASIYSGSLTLLEDFSSRLFPCRLNLRLFNHTHDVYVNGYFWNYAYSLSKANSDLIKKSSIGVSGLLNHSPRM